MSKSPSVHRTPRPLRGSLSIGQVLDQLGQVMDRVGGRALAWFLFAAGLAAVAAAAGPAQPDEPGLTDGIWIGPTPSGDTVLQLVSDGDHLAGHSYLVRDGKALSEIPVEAVTVEPIDPGTEGERGVSVEIRLRTGWTLRARLSADRDRLDGVLDVGGGRRQEVALHRAALASVPALAPRPPAAPGEAAFKDQPPAETGDGWATARAGDAGLDPAGIQALMNDVLAGEAGLIHSLLMVKGDRLVVEEYFHGFSRDDLHAINSCTKSVASLLVGLAIARGELAGVDTRVLALFPELRDGAAPGWEDLRVEHLLTMTSGTTWRGGRPPAGPALVRAALSQPPVSPPGARWSYSDLSADLLGAVLQRATGVQADEFAASHLFAPLGITRWSWDQGRSDGFPRLYGTLQLRPRDLAKLGALVLAGGRWQGQQVISEGWIRESTRDHVQTDDAEGAGYGYLWWLEPVPPSFPGPILAARGVGSQIAYVAPALDLVVVVTGGNTLNGLDFRIGELLLRHLGPAATEPAPTGAPETSSRPASARPAPRAGRGS